jgi:hypothetical protein
MHTFQLTTTFPTHRRLSDSALGILRELPAGTTTTRPVDPADFEASYPAGPQRLEALARWKSAIRIPFDDQTVTPEAVWEEILAVV